MNLKNVNALITRELLGFTLARSLTMISFSLPQDEFSRILRIINKYYVVYEQPFLTQRSDLRKCARELIPTNNELVSACGEQLLHKCLPLLTSLKNPDSNLH